MAKLSSAARVARSDDELDVDYSERNGFLTGKAAALADWSHRKEEAQYKVLFARLYARDRRLKDPERARAICRAWRARNPERARELDLLQRLRKYRPKPCACLECGKAWKTKRGERKTRFCGLVCRNRWNGKRRRPRSRGIRNMSISRDVRTTLEREPWLTLRELCARLPGAKFGSLATLLSTWAKAGSIQQRKNGRIASYALRPGLSNGVQRTEKPE